MADVIIVGSPFFELCDNKKIFSFTSFLELELKKFRIRSITLAQGLTIEEVDVIYKLVSSIYPNCIFKDDYSKLCSKENDNKKKEKNILITKLEKYSTYNFGCNCVIQCNSEFISDHVTGIHVPGFLLMEASRQFLISALEYEGIHNYRFILSSISSNFKKYVFPFPFQLNAIINTEGNKSQLSTTAVVDIIQNEESCASIQIDSFIVPEKIAFFNEKLSKNTLLNNFIKSKG